MTTKRNYAIAIDGPAGSGKSTMARRVAKDLGFVYVDTGAIYRTVGYHMDFYGIGPKDTDGITRLIGDVNIQIEYDADGLQHMMLNGRDVTDDIRTPEMSKIASVISAQKVVRDYLLDMQRQLARTHNVVMDGRDIGTVVLPGADVKIFLTADPEVRARRRFDELTAKGEKVQYEKVLKDLIARDEQDRNRKIAPLRPAKDAVHLDTTDLNIEQAAAAMESIIKEKLGQL
ncbi:(d)CMP kinase [Candidatus Avoscillospira sp. LCP25S3_F1]|uniref:(d)CMP kinase n=1 Tax=Candidatus Avoscillospira sp. LCP25S3_F1 TaxID=3438825 RepID=UPI003F91DE6C